MSKNPKSLWFYNLNESSVCNLSHFFDNIKPRKNEYLLTSIYRVNNLSYQAPSLIHTNSKYTRAAVTSQAALKKKRPEGRQLSPGHIFILLTKKKLFYAVVVILINRGD